MNISDLTGKKILILGFGQEGQATYVFLKNRIPNVQIAIADAKSLEEMSNEVQNIVENTSLCSLHLGKTYLDSLDQYDVIIKTPGISFHLPQIEAAFERGIPFTSATEIFFSEVQGQVIGITGSKGKSTTCSLLFDIFQAAEKHVELIGNIGAPALDYLQKDAAEKMYIFELSSYQLEHIKTSPHVGLITSFFPAHLDHHADLEEYLQAKLNLFRFMNSDDIAFYSPKYSEIAQNIEGFNCIKIMFNYSESSMILNGFLIHNGERIMPIADVPLLGQHNLENILGVIAVAKLYDISNEIIASTIHNFSALEHRLELVGEFQNIRFYNDSQSSTPNSTIAAIDAFGKDLETIILGGLDNGISFEKLAKVVAFSQIKNVVLFPDTGIAIWKEIQKACTDLKQDTPHHVFTQNMKEAVQQCYALTDAGKICLLSPACQSFNMFVNLKERGRQFKQYVRNYE